MLNDLSLSRRIVWSRVSNALGKSVRMAVATTGTDQKK